MYTALYRDFRPDNFNQLIGQDHIVKILKNQIASGQTGHAYLFCGTRGTGKTTTARILAKALNCEGSGEKPCCECENCKAIREGSFIDVVEIDAASNNGVDNIRELRESVKYPPIKGKCKVYIIDEVHMLTTGAFNALLKTLEEPPENIVFILATTEVQKLPATILSRCMRLDFRMVSEPVLISNMKMICQARGIEAEDAALALIAVNADGSVRDSLSILEQCIAGGGHSVTREDVAGMLGVAGEEMLIELTGYVMSSDIQNALILLENTINAGRDVKQLMKEWLAHFRNLLMAKYVKDPENMLNMSMENVNRVKEQSEAISTELLNRGITELTKTIADARWSSQSRVLLEMCIVRLGMGRQEEANVVFREDGIKPQNTGNASLKVQPRRTDFSNTQAKQTESPEIPLQQTEVPAQPAEDPTQQTEVPVQPADIKVQQTEAPTQPAGIPDAQADAPGESAAAVPDDNRNTSGKSQEELDKLWNNVVRKAMVEKGSLIRLETHSRLTKIDDKYFYVQPDDMFTFRTLEERSRDLLEPVMEQIYGSPLKMMILNIDSGSNSDDDGRKKAENLSKKLGIQVELK